MLGPVTEGMGQSTVSGSEFDTTAMICKKGGGKESSPDLEAGLIGPCLIRPEEWGVSGPRPLPCITTDVTSICRADFR
jgi:hypothetical protein